jgi:hypothetical protein
MAQISLTDYEVEQDLLPAVCARCGQPATERDELSIRIIDGWQGLVLLPLMIIGLFCLPPLLFLIIGNGKKWRVRVPLCSEHKDDHDRRRRMSLRRLLPIWTVAAIVVDVDIIAEAAMGGPGLSCGAAMLVFFLAVFADVVLITRGAVQVARPGKTGIQLKNVHPDFVAAVIEDRARDRIDDPDRRAGFGDHRDDYDDEPV